MIPSPCAGVPPWRAAPTSRRTSLGVLCLALGLAAATIAARAAESDGWTIPRSGSSEVNPITPSPEVTAAGQRLYRSKCQRCHGPAGRGDGPEADPDRPPQDLTDPARATRNPDGVLFYKIWNGRRRPKMPAFSADLTRDEAWTLVHFVKSLRK